MYICIPEVDFFYYNNNFEWYSVFSRISMHPTAISVPSRNPNPFTWSTGDNSPLTLFARFRKKRLTGDNSHMPIHKVTNEAH
jgi:hypothetical protein